MNEVGAGVDATAPDRGRAAPSAPAAPDPPPFPASARTATPDRPLLRAPEASSAGPSRRRSGEGWVGALRRHSVTRAVNAAAPARDHGEDGGSCAITAATSPESTGAERPLAQASRRRSRQREEIGSRVHHPLGCGVTCRPWCRRGAAPSRPRPAEARLVRADEIDARDRGRDRSPDLICPGRSHDVGRIEVAVTIPAVCRRGASTICVGSGATRARQADGGMMVSSRRPAPVHRHGLAAVGRNDVEDVDDVRVLSAEASATLISRLRARRGTRRPAAPHATIRLSRSSLAR